MRVRAGDLALVVCGQGIPENIGKVVEVQRVSTVFPEAWICEAKGGPILASWSKERLDTPVATFFDVQLQPLRPYPELVREILETVRDEL